MPKETFDINQGIGRSWSPGIHNKVVIAGLGVFIFESGKHSNAFVIKNVLVDQIKIAVVVDNPGAGHFLKKLTPDSDIFGHVTVGYIPGVLGVQTAK